MPVRLACAERRLIGIKRLTCMDRRRPAATVLRLLSVVSFLTAIILTRTVTAAPYCAPDPASAPNAATTQHTLAAQVEQRLGAAPVNNIGPLAETLAAELRAQLCADPGTASLLPSTCTATLTNLSALRTSLVLDLLGFSTAALASQRAVLAPAQALALGFLGGLSGGLGPAEVSHRVAVRLGYAAGESCLAPSVNADDRLGLAVLLVWQLSQEQQPAAQLSEERALAVITATLSQARGGAALTPTELALAQQLAKQTRITFQWWTLFQQQPGDHQTLSQLLLSELNLFQAALALTHSQQLTLPAETWAVIQTLLQGNLDATVTTLRQWSAIPATHSSVLSAAETVLRFTRARTREEAERIVRGQVLGLGPWSEKVLFSASAGLPQLQSDNFNIVGEGLLGYNGELFGVVAAGGASVLEFESDDYVASTNKFFANGDAWLNLALSERSVLDVRGTVDFVIFDSDTLLLGSGNDFLNGEEMSLLVRGGALVGYRYEAPAFGVGGWVGGSAQLSSYDVRATSGQLDDVGNADTSLQESQSLGGAAQARVRVQWAVAPRVLALRSSVDWKMYSLTRMAANFDNAGGSNEFVQTDEGALQLEAIGRAFVDIEAARVFDFVPAAGIGIDHYQLVIEGQETQVVTIPVYMLGIRRATF